MSRFRLLSVAAFLLAAFIISAPVALADSAQLIIHRAPNFGNRQWLRIWIDGNEFKAVAVGHDFNAPISPGHHVISVLPTDNPWHFPPTKRPLNAQADRTYEFTAFWQNDRVRLESVDRL